MRLCVSEWAWYVHWCTPCLNSVVRLWSSTLFGLLCLDVWLTEDLTNETKAVEDVLREEEGKGFCFCLVLEGFFWVCVWNRNGSTGSCHQLQLFDTCTMRATGMNPGMCFHTKDYFWFSEYSLLPTFLVLSQSTDYLLVSCYSQIVLVWRAGGRLWWTAACVF